MDEDIIYEDEIGIIIILKKEKGNEKNKCDTAGSGVLVSQ
jgi:hypothetical protein